jgi:glucosyl-3-phosphoglycerate phosphatase
MTIELHLFRHGRTDWNVLGKFQGHAESSLDELGRRQALAAAERCRGIKPELLFSSDLQRALAVAARMTELTGVEAVPDDRLRERHCGQWSGLTYEEIAVQDPRGIEKWDEASDETFRPGEDGESIEDLRNRVILFLDVVRALDSKRIVVVTHGGWIRAAVECALGATFPYSKLGVPAQASLTVFTINGGTITLEVLNDRGHLLEIEAVDEEPPPVPLV